MHGITSFRWLPMWAAALFCLAAVSPASAEDVPDVKPTPHIALILPTQAPGSLAAAAAAVQAGAQAAEAREGSDDTPKLRLYPTSEKDEDVLAAYEQAHAAGAISVIGPLTRGAISKLAARGNLDIPVLALNSMGDQKPVPNLFTLGLSIEDEARQIARQMNADNRHLPLIIEAEGTLARRMRTAFVAEWKLLHDASTWPELFVLENDKPAVLSKLKDTLSQSKADSVFLAAEMRKAHLIRSLLPANLPTYATSQAWNGKYGKNLGENSGLEGVKLVDMPWLLDPWSPDVTVFARSEKPLSADVERLYALGLDAYRLSLLLQVSAPGAAIEMVGVTGTLRLSETRQFSRVLTVGVIGAQPASPKPTEPTVEASTPIATTIKDAAPAASSTTTQIEPNTTPAQ